MTSKKAIFVGDVPNPTFEAVSKPRVPEPKYDWNQAVSDYKAGKGDFTDEEAELLKVLVANRAKAEAASNKGTTLYRFFDAEGRLLYVGISLSMLMRLSAHKVDKDWWLEVASCTFEHVGDRQEAMGREREAIEAEKPKYNRAGVPVEERFRGPRRTLQAPNGQRPEIGPAAIREQVAYAEKRRRLGME